MKAYVINLDEDKERLSEFKKNFNFKQFNEVKRIKAVSGSDYLVKNYFDTGKVYMEGKCYECKKIRCRHKMNRINKYQIANFLSFMEVFKMILNFDDEWAFICEDDIIPHTWAQDGIDFVINKWIPTIKKTSPAIIKVGLGIFTNEEFHKPLLDEHENEINDFEIIPDGKRCGNPAFFCNKKFAQQILKSFNSLRTIECLSDTFIHCKSNFPFLEKYTVKPVLFTEKSWGQSATIPSTITGKENLLDFYSVCHKKFWNYFIFCPEEKKIGIWSYLKKNGVEMGIEECKGNGIITSTYNPQDPYIKYWFWQEIPKENHDNITFFCENEFENIKIMK